MQSMKEVHEFLKKDLQKQLGIIGDKIAYNQFKKNMKSLHPNHHQKMDIISAKRTYNQFKKHAIIARWHSERHAISGK